MTFKQRLLGGDSLFREVVGPTEAEPGTYIHKKSDFPPAIAGVITIPDTDMTFFIMKSVNLGTDNFLLPDGTNTNINFQGAAFNTVTLTYEGSNTMFNTVGNFRSNPRAGLIFLDFDHSRTLQLIGRPTTVLDAAD